MIQTKSQYKAYLIADGASLKISYSKLERITNQIWQYQKALRKMEYLVNCRRSLLRRLIAGLRLRSLEQKLGFSIPLNVFGPGLAIVHRGPIIVNADARIGANCRIHACVNIGARAGFTGGAPSIGDNCYIGPGAVVFGPIRIGPDTAIGANAVVNRDFTDGGVTLAGVPARISSNKSSDGLVIKGWTNS